MYGELREKEVGQKKKKKAAKAQHKRHFTISINEPDVECV